jgi:myo-inositol-1(or 4)-monophosphatase
MHDHLEFTTNLAIKAGNLLLDYYDPAGMRVSQKPDHTVLTEADLAADKLITTAIRENYPQDEIISEESSHHLENNESPVWIIDPLDGTTNFSLGLSIWGVSIAWIKDGYPSLGVLYFPMINELYTCERGSGAFLNHSPISTRAPDLDQPMSFFACCSRSFRYYNINIPFKPRILGSSAYTFCMVARGAALLGLDAASKIWDLAAGWLLVEKAGGKIAAFDGTSPFPISTQKDFSVTNFPILVAATPEVFSLGQNKIQRKSKDNFVARESDS